MQDNALFSLIISTIIAGEATAGIAGTPIAQAFQPTMEGVNTQPTAFLYKIGDRRYGFVKYEDVWDELSSTMVHTETQQYETTFQISALSTQNPATPTQRTASDLLNLIASILQSQQTLTTFMAQNVGIERVMDVRNPYFIDDRAQNAAMPSLDFTLTHLQVITSSVPPVSPIEIQIRRV